MTSFDLDSKEQTLIQHVRTSGIAQARELSLVSEVLDIRKERKRLFAGFNEQIVSLQADNQRLKDSMNQYHEAAERQLRQLTEAQALDHETHQQRLATLESSLRNEHHSAIEIIKLSETKKQQCMQHGYESQIQLLSQKLKDILIERDNRDLAQAKSIANKITKKLSHELQSSYDTKIAEYLHFKTNFQFSTF